jgi:transcriptional regulator with XRE-family HTH domain
MAQYYYFQPSLVEFFAKQKMGSISNLLKAIEKDGSWWHRSKKKPTIKVFDVERLAQALNVHPTEFYSYSESDNKVEEEAVLYVSQNAEISARILQLVQIKSENNQTKFAESTGISKAQISNIIGKKHAPGFHTISRIIKSFPDISARWLLVGEGSPLSSEKEDRNLRELVESKDEIIKLLKSKLAALEKSD